jgi:RimJ/RimL family protein N-acetyltransferase
VSFYIKKVSQQDWNMLSKDAHMISFGVIRDPSLDRISFALIAVDNQGEVSGYVTCVEMDSETLYWQHGGAMPEYAGTIYTIKGYSQFINWSREHYKRVSTKIENTNSAMLKLAMKLGFKIVGTHTFKNKVYVDLLNEFGG